MTPEHAFLSAIKEEPDDDGLRLVFADWLEDQGQADRAELIRLQCHLARLPLHDPDGEQLGRREQALLARHAEEWLGGLKGLADAWEFRRGLLWLEVAEGEPPPGGVLPRVRDALRRLLAPRAAPEPLLDRLAHARAWPWVEGLRLILRSARDAVRLLSSGHLANLTSLDLSFNGIGAEGARALAESPHLARLSAVDLGDNGIGVEGARALAESPHLARLSALGLGSNGIGVEGARALAASPYLARLTSLDLSLNGIGEEGARALATSPHLAGLSALDLGDNGIGAEGAWALAASPRLANLTSLELNYNGIGAKGARVLAQSPHLAHLTSLDLYGNQIGDEGARALATSPHLGRLTSLELGSAGIGPEALALLWQRFGREVVTLDEPDGH